jgi:hypothetical protein
MLLFIAERRFYSVPTTGFTADRLTGFREFAQAVTLTGPGCCPAHNRPLRTETVCC